MESNTDSHLHKISDQQKKEQVHQKPSVIKEMW